MTAVTTPTHAPEGHVKKESLWGTFPARPEKCSVKPDALGVLHCDLIQNKCTHYTDAEGEIACTSCGSVLGTDPVVHNARDLGYETTHCKPNSTIEFQGLGTDQKAAVGALRSAKPGGSQNAINHDIAAAIEDGEDIDDLNINAIKSEHNVVSPAGLNYITTSDIAEDNSRTTFLKDALVEEISRLIRNMEGYSKLSSGFQLKGNEAARFGIKLLRKRLEELCLTPQHPGAETMIDQIAMVAVRETIGNDGMLAVREAFRRKKNGR